MGYVEPLLKCMPGKPQRRMFAGVEIEGGHETRFTGDCREKENDPVEACRGRYNGRKTAQGSHLAVRLMNAMWLPRNHHLPLGVVQIRSVYGRSEPTRKPPESGAGLRIHGHGLPALRALAWR